ncbi:threonine/serine exporter family protein [Maribellus sp. CM-23]|uniref:threonine/serine exporter family protein n=1 Tax=Maribellus sp. CM-23 TaxID=2781026 RepID=UPI001F463DE2|nr:threonine/serine exporter family protein [Maribellus sp. CM-23]MCE4564811.1 threonine/serine exporter family protein [Maribellus sp. CM-23]
MQEWLHFIDRWFWLGMGAIGFAILFNVPKRTIFTIFLLGAFGGTLKFIVLAAGGGIILGSFFGAMLVGFASIFAAHYRHTPPFVLAIPAVIPMVPGAFAYRAMLGIIHLTEKIDHETFLKLMEETVDNGLKAFFVLAALSLGVSAPMLIFRRESAKNLVVRIKPDEARSK